MSDTRVFKRVTVHITGDKGVTIPVTSNTVHTPVEIQAVYRGDGFTYGHFTNGDMVVSTAHDVPLYTYHVD